MSIVPIPPLDTATDPIHSPADLSERWRALIGPYGFAERRLWLTFVGADRRMHTVLSELPIPREPDRGVVLDLLAMLTMLLDDVDEPTTVAMMLTRPGRDRARASDHRWAQALTDTARRAGVPIEPIFLANDRSIEPVWVLPCATWSGSGCGSCVNMRAATSIASPKARPWRSPSVAGQ